MNLVAVLAAAKRAQAAYFTDAASSRAAFEALGLDWLGLYQNEDHQAVVSREHSSGAVYLSISGTRFTDGRVGDLYDDLDLTPVDVGDGALVARGAFQGLSELWTWAASLVAPETLWNVEGHSLGGWRARYTPLFLPAEQIGQVTTFEAPKSANDLYWAKYAGVLKDLVTVVNGRDIFVSYPFLGEVWTQPPMAIIWIEATGYSVITREQWPIGLFEWNHSIDEVVQRLERLITTP